MVQQPSNELAIVYCDHSPAIKTVPNFYQSIHYTFWPSYLWKLMRRKYAKDKQIHNSSSILRPRCKRRNFNFLLRNNVPPSSAHCAPRTTFVLYL